MSASQNESKVPTLDSVRFCVVEENSRCPGGKAGRTPLEKAVVPRSRMRMTRYDFSNGIYLTLALLVLIL